ncbi:MAG TPA: lipid-A-disaccharide synthase N-terminal domain-containing protein [Microvirga sp.]
MPQILEEFGGYLHTVFVTNLDMVVVIGLIGQALFSARFLVQWIASERAGRSVVPVAFWFFSLGGGAVLFAYALYRGDPVFIVGQGLGTFIYVRNLMLIAKEKRRKQS